MILLEIPVKSYIRHYLQHRFGEPCAITKDNQIGKFLIMLIGDNSQRRDSEHCPYKDKLVVKITEDIFSRNGFLLTPTNITCFNNYMEDLIKNEIFLQIDTIREHNQTIKIKTSIEMVLNKMMFHESVWPYESVKKAYDRHRSRKNVQLITRLSMR